MKDKVEQLESLIESNKKEILDLYSKLDLNLLKKLNIYVFVLTIVLYLILNAY